MTSPMKKKVRREPIVLSQMRPVTLLLVLCGCIMFAFALQHFDGLLRFGRKILSALGPVLAGLVIAYLLNPAQTWLEKRMRKLLRPFQKKHPAGTKTAARGISAFLAVLLFVGAVTLLVIATFSQVMDGVETLIRKLPQYMDILANRVEKILADDNRISQYLEQLSERIFNLQTGVDPTETAQTVLSAIWSGAAGTIGILYDVVVGVIVSVYLLISKETFIRQFKRILYAVVNKDLADSLNKGMAKANRTFGTAILGKLVDSTLIGIICFIGLVVMNMPYTALIAVIIGVTNVIPFFGPIIGAIPCVLLILMENPWKALYFLIFIIALQQFDCNFLDPKIVGKSIGLPAFWELFACLLGGGLFGIVGMAIGVPFFAVFYAILDEAISKKLRREFPDEFLEHTLGYDLQTLPKSEEEAETEEESSDYVQHLILLEELSNAEDEK